MRAPLTCPSSVGAEFDQFLAQRALKAEDTVSPAPRPRPKMQQKADADELFAL